MAGEPNGTIFVLVAGITAMTAIVTRHLRRLAEIRFARPPAESHEVAALRREVQELKEMVHTQILALDNYTKRSVSPPADEDLRSRISSGGG